MVGESGFGRSVTMPSTLGMIPDPSGKGTWGSVILIWKLLPQIPGSPILLVDMKGGC
jgi:ABC-type dipeptide/oligopeptide/nickel transport system ATPase component